MALFGIRDLAHWVAWGYLLVIWKHQYSLSTGGNCFFGHRQTIIFICDSLWIIHHRNIYNILSVFVRNHTYLHVDISFLCYSNVSVQNKTCCILIGQHQIVFILSSRHIDCKITLITTHCFSNVSIERIYSMALFIICDLTH